MPKTPFPVDVFPDAAQSFVDDLARSHEVPIEAPATFCLGALAAPLVGRVVVEVEPSWREPVTLWVLVAMRSGEKKSPTLNALLKPVHGVVEEIEAASIPAHREAVERVSLARERVKQAKKAALDGGDEAAYLAAVAALTEAEAVLSPTFRLFVQDVTPEALLDQHAGRCGLVVASAEGGVLEALTGSRYRSAGAPRNLDTILIGHDGDRYSIDRKNQDAPLVVPSVNLSMILGGQPEHVAAMIGDAENRDRGLVSRLLLCAPSPVTERPDTRPRSNPGAADGWRWFAERHTREALTRPDTLTLGLDPGAEDIARGLELELREQIGDGGALAGMSGWVGKSTGSVIRVAGVLSLAHGEQTVSARRVSDAVRVVRFYAGELSAYAEPAGTVSQAVEVLTLLVDQQREGEPIETVRDLHRRLGKRSRWRGRPVDDVQKALDELASTSHLRVSVHKQKASGRSSTRIELHPLAGVEIGASR